MQRLRIGLDWLEWWFLWILVTGVSWCVGLILALIVARIADLALPPGASLVISGVVAGTLIGLVQWALLNPEVKGVGLWSLATTVGWIGGLVITAFFISAANVVLGGMIGVALGGLFFGLAQRLALRPHTDGGKWLLGTIAGWTAAVMIGINMGGNSRLEIGPSEVVKVAASGAVGWVTIGLVAVAALVTLFPVPEKKESTSHVRWWP